MNIFQVKDQPQQWQAYEVSGAGTPEANGRYEWVGYYNGFPLFAKVGASDTIISWDGSVTVIGSISGGSWYKTGNSPNNLIGATWTSFGVGVDPVPFVVYADTSTPNSGFVYASVAVFRPVYYNLVNFVLGNQLYAVNVSGNYTGVIISHVPSATLPNTAITGFWYAWNVLENTTPDSTFGFYHGNPDGTGNYPPLIIRGADAVRGLCVAGADANGPQNMSIQLLTGSV